MIPTLPGVYWARLSPDASDQIVVTDGRRFHFVFTNANLFAREVEETFPRAVFSERIDPLPFREGKYLVVGHQYFVEPAPPPGTEAA